MRNCLAALLVASAVTACTTPAAEGLMTVTGVVIDLGCYARNSSNTGMDHDRAFACAFSCVKWEGQPVGLLTSDAVVYQFAGGLVANNNARIAPHLAHRVSVTGNVTVRDGMRVIAADDVSMEE